MRGYRSLPADAAEVSVEGEEGLEGYNDSKDGIALLAEYKPIGSWWFLWTLLAVEKR
jgi:hypothetical protein